MSGGGGEINFEKAEYDAKKPSLSCAICSRAIVEPYFERGGKIWCASCRTQADTREGSSTPAGRATRAVVFGALAGALGALLYFGVRALTGYEIGIVAVILGVLVGMAVRVGAFGRGGMGYQALAVFLTYLAIASTYVPMVLAELRGQKPETSVGVKGDAAHTTSATVAAGVANDAPDIPSAATAVAVLPVLLLLGTLALPIAVAVQNPIMLLIIGFALFEAWRLDRRTDTRFAGPFALGGDVPRPAQG